MGFLSKGLACRPGFTLAELLIALVIIGEIATFTIPKIITSQQNNTYNAKAHEAISMVSAAYELYQLNNGTAVPSTMAMGALTQYMNYVSTDTASLIDDVPGYSSQTCGGSNICLNLHNGAKMMIVQSAWNFGGTSSTNVNQAWIDPDGVYSGTTNGAGKTLVIELYYTGRVTTYGTVGNTFCGSWACPFSASASNDPTWFTW